MTAGTDQAELFDPRAHEALTETAWDTDRAGAAIREIVAEAERAFEHDSLWPPHPLDEDDDEPPLGQVACLYLGAAGVIWALHALERGGAVELGREWAAVAASLPERYRAAPDFPDDGVIPSLWFGEAGILLVAQCWRRVGGWRMSCSRRFARTLRIRPSSWRGDRRARCWPRR